jgi:alpha-galactosidase
VLLRDRFHELTNEEVRSLLLFAGLSGGVLMTSDKLDEIPPERADLFAFLLSERRLRCEFPSLGSPDEKLVIQRATRPDGTVLLNLFNTGETALETKRAGGSIKLAPHESRLVADLPCHRN